MSESVTEQTEEKEESNIIISPNPYEPNIKFVNTAEFSREAQYFLDHGYYTNAPEGTMAWYEYWDEQERRCREGYTVGGVTITGRHYDYLNFTQILAREGNRKKHMFPRFLDMDYYYYHEVDRAIEAGQGLIVGKARRKGFSFKNAQLTKYEFVHVAGSISGIFAYLDGYAKNTTNMTRDMINFNNTHCCWYRECNPNNKDFMKARYRLKENGAEFWRGTQSEIHQITFYNNPSAAIGKTFSFALFEEAGKWPTLEDCWAVTEDTFLTGDITTGFWIIFGTAGKLGTQDADAFERMFFNPWKYNLRAYENVYEDSENEYCGYFVPDYLYREPHIDKEGNSLKKKALESNKKMRKVKEKDSKNANAATEYISLHPLFPSEIFINFQGGVFPYAPLVRRLKEILKSEALQSFGERGKLSFQNPKTVIWNPDSSLKEAVYPFSRKQSEGCITIYEHPKKGANGAVPEGLYFAATDPYTQDDAITSTSVGSTFIYKRFLNSDQSHNWIVAEYSGRPATAEQYYEGVRKLLMYYNAVCLFENETRGMKVHFMNKNSLQYLAPSPMNVLRDALPNSRVNRGFGVHVPATLKNTAILWLKEWLNEEREDGKTNIDYIYSVNLLEELIRFVNVKNKNFDRVSALIVLMIFLKENEKVVVEQVHSESKTDILDFMFDSLGF